MNTEILIERYRRHNESEQIVLAALIRNFEPTIYDKNNTESIIRGRIKRTKGLTIFLDAENSNLTASGLNYRKTEIRVASKKSSVFTEVKHQTKISNIQDAVLGEIARAKNVKGKYWLVLLGKAYRRPIVIAEFFSMIAKYKLDNKVRIFTTVEEYILALQDEIL